MCVFLSHYTTQSSPKLTKYIIWVLNKWHTNIKLCIDNTQTPKHLKIIQTFGPDPGIQPETSRRTVTHATTVNETQETLYSNVLSRNKKIKIMQTC